MVTKVIPSFCMNTLNKSLKPDSQDTEGSHGISTQEAENRECFLIIVPSVLLDSTKFCFLKILHIQKHHYHHLWAKLVMNEFMGNIFHSKHHKY